MCSRPMANPRECVEHDRQVEEAGPGRNVGHVGHPKLVGFLGVEVPVHKVGGRANALVADGRPRASATADPDYAVGLHQAFHPLATDMDAFSGKLGVNARCSVGLLRSLVNAADLRKQLLVRQIARRRLAADPAVEAAARDLHRPRRSPLSLGPMARQGSLSMGNSAWFAVMNSKTSRTSRRSERTRRRQRSLGPVAQPLATL